MAVPYTFGSQTGPIPLRELDDNFAFLDEGNFAASAADTPSDAILIPPSTTGGYYSDFDCQTAFKWTLVQGSQITETESGAIRDCIFSQSVDRDTYNYDSDGYRVISDTARFVMTGCYNTGSGWATQYKDMVAGTFHAVARVGGSGSARGVSAVVAQAVNRGGGVCTNEFGVENPSGSDHSALMVGVYGIVYNGVSDSDDTSHRAFGVVATVYGYTINAAFRASSRTGYAGQNGYAKYGIDMGDLTTTTAAIVMPDSLSGNVGTLILYDSGDYTEYDRGNNRYIFRINDSASFVIGANGISLAGGTSAASQVVLAAGSITRSQIRFADGVAPSSPQDGDFWREGTDLKIRFGGTTYTLLKS